MKRLLVFAMVVALTLAASSLLLAQANPFVGTWKLNPAKSKYTSGAPLKEGTITVQMVDDQDQVTVNETAADGSPISLKYELPDKGGAGKILAGTYDAVSGRWIDDNIRETSMIKGGKEIGNARSVVSNDGKTMSITNKGKDTQGKPVSRVTIWEKQ
jgi:hypothetical protein